MPVEALEPGAEVAEHRIGRALRRDVERRPGEFLGAAQNVLAAVGPRQQLAAEADPEHRLVGVAEAAHHARKGGQVRIGRIVDRALLAAEDDQAVVVVGA